MPSSTEIRSILTISDPTPPPLPANPSPPHMVQIALLPEVEGSQSSLNTLPTIPQLSIPPSSPGLETSILSTTLNTPSGPIVQYFNVTTRANPPPLSAVQFAPLPELAPRKRKNQTPLGIKARGQMMARRRAMLAYGGKLPDDHPLNKPPQPDGPSNTEQSSWSEQQPRHSQTHSDNTSLEELDDPFIALGKMVKGVWKKVSNKDMKSSATPRPPSETTEVEKQEPQRLKKRASFKRGRTASNASEKGRPDNLREHDKPPPPVPSLPSQVLAPKRPPSSLRKSALVVADEADRAGAIAPLVHQPNENGGEVPSSLDSSANSSDCEDDNWQTATIRPDEDRSVTTTEEDEETTEDDEGESSRSSSLPSSLDEDVKTPTDASSRLRS